MLKYLETQSRVPMAEVEAVFSAEFARVFDRLGEPVAPALP
jgi:hypothetical protein